MRKLGSSILTGAPWLILNVIYFRPPHRVGRQPLRPTYGNVRLP
jgi:hypothetical protein